MASFSGTPNAVRWRTSSRQNDWTTSNVGSREFDLSTYLEVEYRIDNIPYNDIITAAGITLTLEAGTNRTVKIKCEAGYELNSTFHAVKTVTETISVTAPSTNHTFTFSDVPFKVYDELIYRISRVSGTATITAPSVNVSTSAPPTPSAPSLIAPRNTTLDGDTEIEFSWSLASETYLRNLQYSRDEETWIDLELTYTGATSGTVPAGKFSPGTVYWRANSTNQWGGESTWATASFNVAYSATSQVAPVNTPTSGTISTQAARTFQVGLEVVGSQSVSFTIAAAALFWRAGTSGAWTELSMTASGDRASVTIPAGSFSQGKVQWKASATDNMGTTTETEIYTLTAINASIVAIPQSPINTLESGQAPILFRWRVFSLDESPQIAAQLRYSTDGVNYTTFLTVTSGATNGTAPAGTFPGGTIYWQARAKSETAGWGPWSDAVTFKAFSSAIVEGVTADGKPFCTVTWQVTGQVAYAIEVDGETYGPYLDPDARSYTLKEPLSDGNHVFRVKVQNRFSLWSESAEATASVTNVPGAALNALVDAAGGSAVLTILAANPSAGPFLIYRNGVLIGKTSNLSFTDRLAIGVCAYAVYQVLAGGYYTKATAQDAARIAVSSPVIGALAGGEWIELSLSENPNRVQTVTRGRQTASVYYAGSKYPSAEIGRQESLSATGDAAFMYSEEEKAAAFEALVGRAVIYKTPGGAMVVGVLEALPRTDKEFYRAYSFSVKQMHWRDFVDES